MSILEKVKADDVVEYYIFLREEMAEIQSLVKVYDHLLSFISPIVENYIWHRDEFTVSKIIPTESEKTPLHLHGILQYGDNIEDEWFLVYLLLAFSKQRNDIFIKLIDSDGEFLLIEAAVVLPECIQSEKCSYQSYLHDGMVKIIPVRFSTESFTVSKITKHLKSNESSRVEQSVTQIIEDKVNRYKECLNDFLHRSRVYIPVKIAGLLAAKPNLIASAITAYCQRDAIDVKICRKMKHFPPENMVTRLITFTKFLYAMVSHEKVMSERNQTLWPLPPSSKPNFKEHSLGFKITCGFEILASKCQNFAESDLSLNKKWMQYLTVLKRKGYFKDFIEGSKDYVNLEKQARNYFLDNTESIKADSNCILNVLQTVNYDYSAMKHEESKLPSSEDEDWMHIDEESFNKFLKEKFNCTDIRSTDSPEVLSSALKAFFSRVSDIEGIETDETNNLNVSSMGVDCDSEAHSVSFDVDDFLPSLEQMLDTMAMENENGNLDDMASDNSDSEYESDNDEDARIDVELKSYMRLMDEELENTSLSDNMATRLEQGDGNAAEENILNNIRKSYEEQYGGCGPAGNLLQSIGLRLDVKRNE